jgi:hypothetical protein
MSVHSKIESFIDGQKPRLVAAIVAGVAIMPAVASAETVANYGGCQKIFNDGKPLAANLPPGISDLGPGQVNAEGDFSYSSKFAGHIACLIPPK